MTSRTPAPDRPWSAADFVGGHSALDFLNTVADTGKSRCQDRIADWPSLYVWASAGAPGLSGLRADTALDSADALAHLHDLREHAYTALSGFICDAPDARALDALADHIRAAQARATLAHAGGGLSWHADVRTSHRWHDTLALDLAGLLATPELARLRECGRCTWLFLDHGRGAGRRWCDMRTCGNRAKAEAFRGR